MALLAMVCFDGLFRLLGEYCPAAARSIALFAQFMMAQTGTASPTAHFTA
jgi:hypothetical protein